MSGEDPRMSRRGDIETVSLGETGLSIPRLWFGTAPIASMPNSYGFEVDEAAAAAMLDTVFAGPATCIDTSRNYGDGRAEDRVGRAIRDRGGLPAGFLISTKLDRDMRSGRFDGGRARRPLELSLATLGLDRVPILFLHDPEYAADLTEVTGPGGALAALFEMKEEGLAQAVGLAAGRVDIMMPLIGAWDFDLVLTHNRFTLLNRNAEAMIALAASRTMAVVNAGVFATGVFAKGPDQLPRYAYQAASEAQLAPVRRIEGLCRDKGVVMGAAALRVSMGDPRIAATVCGCSKPEHWWQILDWAAEPIPETFWQALAALPIAYDDPEATRDYKPD